MSSAVVDLELCRSALTGARGSAYGVSWPTASVIPHFCDPGRYPILDVRALWSVGLRRVPGYTFALWSGYTHFVSNISDRVGLSIRTIDRALWRYSKERQR